MKQSMHAFAVKLAFAPGSHPRGRIRVRLRACNCHNRCTRVLVFCCRLLRAAVGPARCCPVAVLRLESAPCACPQAILGDKAEPAIIEALLQWKAQR